LTDWRIPCISLHVQARLTDEAKSILKSVLICNQAQELKEKLFALLFCQITSQYFEESLSFGALKITAKKDFSLHINVIESKKMKDKEWQWVIDRGLFNEQGDINKNVYNGFSDSIKSHVKKFIIKKDLPLEITISQA